MLLKYHGAAGVWTITEVNNSVDFCVIDIPSEIRNLLDEENGMSKWINEVFNNVSAVSDAEYDKIDLIDNTSLDRIFNLSVVTIDDSKTLAIPGEVYLMNSEGKTIQRIN